MKRIIAGMIATVVCSVMLSGTTVYANENSESAIEEQWKIDLSELNPIPDPHKIDPEYMYVVRVSSGNLNVRDWPVTGKVIATLPNGTLVESPFITKGKANVPGWLWIASPVEGYVSMSYLEYPGGR